MRLLKGIQTTMSHTQGFHVYRFGISRQQLSIPKKRLYVHTRTAGQDRMIGVCVGGGGYFLFCVCSERDGAMTLTHFRSKSPYDERLLPFYK